MTAVKLIQRAGDTYARLNDLIIVFAKAQATGDSVRLTDLIRKLEELLIK